MQHMIKREIFISKQMLLIVAVVVKGYLQY